MADEFLYLLNLIQFEESKAERKEEISRLENEKKLLEKELDDVKSKQKRITNDFERLQELFDKQETYVRHVKFVNKQVSSYL